MFCTLCNKSCKKSSQQGFELGRNGVNGGDPVSVGQPGRQFIEKVNCKGLVLPYQRLPGPA